MKKYLLLVFLFFSVIEAYSQKPNYKSINVRYVQPPEDPLPENIKTYYSEIINQLPSFRGSFGKPLEGGAKQLELTGYNRASNETGANIILKLTLHAVTHEAKVHKTTTKEKKDGKWIDIPAEYYTIKASITTSIEMRDVKNNKALITQKRLVSEKVYESTTIEEIGLARKILKKGVKKSAYELQLNLFTKRLDEFNDMVNERYGYPRKSVSMRIARGKGKKHDYTDVQIPYDSIKSVIKENKYTLYKTKSAITTTNYCIDAWKNVLRDYEPNSKKARIGDKIAGGLYMNIAVAYFTQKDWEKVFEYLDKAKDFKDQKSQINKLSKLVTKIRTRELLRQ